MKAISTIVRWFVGVLFIISGLIKLNDPMGFAFKLEEYFSEPVFNLPFLQQFSLGLAIAIVIVEIVLGVMLLIGAFRKFTIGALLLLTIFFSFLTFYSAYFNKVTDCGCFGDALKLTPWQSFTKDIILLVLILILLAGKRFIRPLFNPIASAIVIVLTFVASFWFGYYVLNHLPVVDFRAYKIGADIPKLMEIPEDAPKFKSEITFIYEVDGQKKSFGMNELGNIPEGATFISREEKVIDKGYEPPIYNFTIEKDNVDYLQEYLEYPKVLLITSYDLSKFDTQAVQSLNQLAKKAQENGYKVVGLTASTNEAIYQFETQHDLTYNFYFCDGTTIKTMIRSNPGLMILNYGTIKDKKHWQDANEIELETKQ